MLKFRILLTAKARKVHTKERKGIIFADHSFARLNGKKVN